MLTICTHSALIFHTCNNPILPHTHSQLGAQLECQLPTKWFFCHQPNGPRANSWIDFKSQSEADTHGTHTHTHTHLKYHRMSYTVITPNRDNLQNQHKLINYSCCVNSIWEMEATPPSPHLPASIIRVHDCLVFISLRSVADNKSVDLYI